MKTKINIAVISLLFMMACGTSDQAKEESEEKPETNKMRLKAFNNMYFVVMGDTAVIANQPDSVKAEIFERIDQGNGKWALKTSTGKFLTDDAEKKHLVLASKTQVGTTEQFEIVKLERGEGSQINLKAASGKTVCANVYIGYQMIADCEKPSTWEVLTVEYK